MAIKSLMWILFLVIFSVVTASPTKKSNYIEQETSCREVCGLCDCNGFYCEDECICECSLQEDENLQCIADMEKECDANGLEYELVMQESAKERFLRDVKGASGDFGKHLVILKQKRQSASTEPTVGATPTTAAADIVGAANNASSTDKDDQLGMPITALGFGKKMGALAVPKLLVLIKERLANAPSVPTFAPFVIPTIATTASPAKFSFPALPSLSPVVQPSWLHH